MEVKYRIIMKHISGKPVNNRYEPVESLSRAARFPTIEDYHAFITGHYKPADATQYMPQTIKITFEEVNEDERMPTDLHSGME
jgi:hypothetical protein